MCRWLKSRALLWVGGLIIFSATGCNVMKVADLGTSSIFASSPEFGAALFPIPVSPYLQNELEDSLWETERYDRVPILQPIEGEFAPAFCQDPPSHDEIMRALPSVSGNIPFIREMQRNNVRIVTEPLGDWVDDVRFYPLVGPAQLHHCHYKVRVYFDSTTRSDWPIPFTHRDESMEVVYIDKDHFHRVGNPGADSF
ncbi:MAG: hypothetical protein MK103_06345 [Planctomycetes bacterium]|nr:hypothetical protein [Planctomycetota bacterium]